MTYRIRITQETTGTRATTEYKVVAETGNEKDGGRMFDYVPTNKEFTEETELLDMRIGSLSMEMVIDAILGRAGEGEWPKG